MSTPGRSDQPTTEELAADIARQREQLASTVNELQDKVQVKTAHAKDTAKQAALVAGAVAGVVAVVAVVIVVVKRRRS